MTIAIGMVFGGGIIVAADTNEVLSDGSKRQAQKVRIASTDTACLAIAHATEDGNAAKTLVTHLIADIEGNAVRSWAFLESLLSDRMTQWAGAFYKPPSVQLVVGGRINGSGMALYFCEPPNSVVLQVSGYLGIGSGASVTDPLCKLLFPSLVAPARARLTQLAYLMHRAKEDSALCGGKTTAAIVPSDIKIGPGWVLTGSMEKAEENSKAFDFLLQSTAGAATASDEENLQARCVQVGKSIEHMAKFLRQLDFRVSGGPINLDE